jgi:hypothetical protein
VRSDRDQGRDGFDGALQIRLPRQTAARRARTRNRFRRGVLGAGDRRCPAAEEQTLRHRSGEVRHLAIERTGGAQPDRSGGPAQSVHDAAIFDRDRRRERSAQFEQDQRDVTREASAAFGLLVDGERNGADLVRRPHVDAIHFPVRWHRLEMNDARREHDRERGLPERAHQRP